MIKRIVKCITNVIVYGVAGVAVLTIILSFIGIKPYITMSGSMEPTIQTGSICFINTNESFDNIDVNDVIAFKTGNNMLVTHRVLDITKDGFQTKGDNNDVPDVSAVNCNAFMGKTLLSIPYVGYIAMFFKQPAGLILIIIILITLAISSLLDYSHIKKEQNSAN